MRKIVLAASLIASVFVCGVAHANTTPYLNFPPIDIGIAPAGWNWNNADGGKSGFSLVATTSSSFNKLTIWECVNNGSQTVIAHVYKGDILHLIEIAASSPHALSVFCPPNINQQSYLLTTDDYKDNYVFDKHITILPGDRITILFEPTITTFGGYIQFGVRSTRDTSDLAGKTSSTSVVIPPSDVNQIFPYYPAFELVDETSDCTPGAVGCYSNVLFLPGIEASRLYRPDYSGGTDQLWEPNTESDVTDLYLDKNGKSISTDIYTKDVVDEINIIPDFTGTLQANIYKSFLVDLESWKSTEHLIADYSVVPYDWRLSLDDILNTGSNINGKIYYSGDNAATSTPYIIQELRRLAANSKTRKVTIIAHSNGGLVTKALIKRLEDTHDPILEKIDKIIFVDVPQLGTPQAIGALLHGYDQGLPKDWFPLILTPEIARAFASTSPMPYHLLPSAAYFNGLGGTIRTPPVTFDDGTLTQSFINTFGHAIGNATELHNFLLGTDGRPTPASGDVLHPSILKPAFLAYGENTHQNLDDNWVLPSSISLYQITGWGEETLGSIRYWTGTECVYVQSRCVGQRAKLQYTPEMVMDGDGTVVTPSALAMSTSTANVTRYWVNLDDYNIPLVRRIKHADILEVPTLRSFIKDNILTQTTTALSSFIEDSTPSITSDKRLRYFLHSPLSLSARDTFGNTISVSTSTIPGARYERFGEVQYISLPASSSPILVLNGLAQGSFTLEVQEVQGDTITATTTFAGIPSSTSTVVTINFIDGTIVNASPLRIDSDGNGTIDLSLTPKIGGTVTLPPPDLTPPTTTATTSGILGRSNWYTSNVLVTLMATDTGSGIASTTYSLNGGVWLSYVAPFTVSTEDMIILRYRSTDKAGNQEATNTLTIKIDKTAPEAQISVSTSTQDILIEGTDNLGTTTIAKDATCNYTLTDQAGHTTKLFFTKTYTGKQLTFAKLTSMQYDAAPKINIATSSFLYLWDTKVTPPTLLSQTITANDTFLITALYDKKTNKTTVVILKKKLPYQTTTFAGLKIVKLTTTKGTIGYSL